MPQERVTERYLTERGKVEEGHWSNVLKSPCESTEVWERSSIAGDVVKLSCTCRRA